MNEIRLTSKELQWISEVKMFMEQMKYEDDEDSCMSAGFFEFRESVDWYWECVHNLERILKRHSLTDDVPDTTKIQVTQQDWLSNGGAG